MLHRQDKRIAIVEERVDARGLPKSTLPEECAADPFLKPSEIAEHLKVDKKTVTRWCNEGKFGEAPDVIRLPGKYGHRRIRTSAYNRAIAEANR